MAKIVVTGASGLLGANALFALAGEHQVVGVYHQHAVSAPGIRCLQADLSQADQVDQLLQREQPEWVIHCAAAANVDACQENPEWAYRLNRDMAGYVARACRAVGARLAHISTDLVFDGQRGAYVEDDQPHPINIYGQSKLAGEQRVQEACPNALIVRTNLYGWNALDKFSLAEWFLDRLQSEGAAPGFVDMKSTPILVNDLIDVVEKLLTVSYGGVFHVGGRDCLTKFEFGQKVGQTFELNDFVIRPTSVDDLGLRAPRAKNLCLQGAKVEAALQEKLPGVDEGLNRFRDLYRSGFVDRLKKLPGGKHGNA
ncbi:MAG: SDR family oxidoreductase [Anaerolineales bacterium]